MRRSDRLVLVVGEAPTERSSGWRCAPGSAPSRLARVAGVDVEEAATRSRWRNLIDRPTARLAKGRSFPAARAKVAARRVAAQLAGFKCALLLGRRVAAAFGLRGAPMLRWMSLGGARVAVVPHPSGVSRWWNEAPNRRRARAFLRRALAPAGVE